MSELTNQVAVVTGAGRGIGQAIALKLAESGAVVQAVDIQPEKLEEVVGQVRAAGGGAGPTSPTCPRPTRPRRPCGPSWPPTSASTPWSTTPASPGTTC